MTSSVFLNHDDLLLRDHLGYALDRMAAHDTDFYIGLCANATKLICEDNGTIVPVFTEILPQHRDLSYLIQPSDYLFDPSSFLADTHLIRQGSWKVETVHESVANSIARLDHASLAPRWQIYL